jgi:hypothetical protein
MKVIYDPESLKKYREEHGLPESVTTGLGFDEEMEKGVEDMRRMSLQEDGRRESTQEGEKQHLVPLPVPFAQPSLLQLGPLSPPPTTYLGHTAQLPSLPDYRRGITRPLVHDQRGVGLGHTRIDPRKDQREVSRMDQSADKREGSRGSREPDDRDRGRGRKSIRDSQGQRGTADGRGQYF